jgi:glycosyltransferase involved in cell wall biosynthesis
MNEPKRRQRVALLVNMISPARIPLYASLAEAFDLLILHGGAERNRDTWQGTEGALANAQVRRAWGWKIPFSRKQHGKKFDELYLHFNPGFFFELARFLPDAVITNEMGVRTILALLYGAIFRRPVWVWWGGTVHTEQKKSGRLRNAVRKLVSRWAKRWISYGQSSTEYLLTLGIPHDRILELQNTANEKYFEHPASACFRLHPRPALLYVGQFIARKGVNLLLEAAARVQRQGLEFSLLLVGSGPDLNALQQTASSLRLQNVYFESPRAPHEMPGVYRSADALVFPTLEDPWGLVASEAMLAGLPVLCSRYAGCAHELFGDESIFDPEDAEDFAAKLRAAVSGQLPPPDLSRLRTTPEVAAELIHAIYSSRPGQPREMHTPDRLSVSGTR